MTDRDVRAGYTQRAAEYVTTFGSIAAMPEADRELISRWAGSLSGRIVDAGCGPGHWADFLVRQGNDVEGVDLTPAFVEVAKARFPQVPFRVGSLENLELSGKPVAGIMSWYSMIHLEPERVPKVLSEFARSLVPGGSLLLGFCRGDRVEVFAHAVTPAYFWPVAEMVAQLEIAGFEVLQTHTRDDPNARPHAAVEARYQPS